MSHFTYCPCIFKLSYEFSRISLTDHSGNSCRLQYKSRLPASFKICLFKTDSRIIYIYIYVLCSLGDLFLKAMYISVLKRMERLITHNFLFTYINRAFISCLQRKWVSEWELYRGGNVMGSFCQPCQNKILSLFFQSSVLSETLGCRQQ